MKDKNIYLGKKGDRYLLENPEILDPIIDRLESEGSGQFIEALEHFFKADANQDIRAFADRFFSGQIFGTPAINVIAQYKGCDEADHQQILKTLSELWQVKTAFEFINKDPVNLYVEWLKKNRNIKELVKDSEKDPAAWRALIEMATDAVNAGGKIPAPMKKFIVAVLTGRPAPKRTGPNPHENEPRDFAIFLFVWTLAQAFPEMPVFQQTSGAGKKCIIEYFVEISNKFGILTTYETSKKAYQKYKSKI